MTLVWLAALVAVVVAAIVRSRVRSRRQRALLQLCLDAGVGFSVFDPFGEIAFLPFPWFASTGEQRIENVVWDRADERVRVFDYRRSRSDRHSALERTCAMVAMPFAVPTIAVLPRGESDEMLEFAPARSVPLELEAFERRFDARGDDPRAVVALLDQRMMQTIMRLPLHVAIYAREDRMLLVAPMLPPPEVLVLLRVASELAERVPRVVASLYPPRPAEGPYEDRWLQGSWSPDPTGADAPNPGSAGG
jgi:hypothetical protein